MIKEDWTPSLSADTCTQTTTSAEHLFLRDLVCSWHQEALFNLILTPNYNADHHDHIHADLTPDADFIDRGR
ncbi:MAG: extensin family protein [Actinomycetota bacterium]|nr:extensin family protein [Actinomycetota bacterium]